MNFWEQIKQILLRLFGKKPMETPTEQVEKEKSAERYEDISDINITAIIAGKLATLATTDSDVAIEGDNKRAEHLALLTDKAWDKVKRVVGAGLGYGAIAMIPYTDNGEIFTSYIPANRCIINATRGDRITDITLIADTATLNNAQYIRWTDYTMQGDTCIIRNRATVAGKEVPLHTVPTWAEIAEEIHIPNVDRLPLAYFKCPADNRRPDKFGGNPITYGSEKLIADIMETLEQVKKEYKLKQVFVGADSTMFDKHNRLPQDGLFKRFDSGTRIDGTSMWEIFDPVIRHSSYSARLESQFELLEKSIGTSKGILTNAETSHATATEIKRASYDTWALIAEIRKQVETAYEDLIHAYDVLCNYYSITPMGEYDVKWEWDYSLLEDTTEGFRQLTEGVAHGAVDVLELRRFIFPSETLEQSEEAIRRIREKEPTALQLLGE